MISFVWLFHAHLVIAQAFLAGYLSPSCERVWGYGGPEYVCPAGWSYERCHGSFALDCPTPGLPGRSRIFCIGENC